MENLSKLQIQLKHLDEKVRDISILFNIAEHRHIAAAYQTDSLYNQRELARKECDEAKELRDQAINALKEEGKFIGSFWDEYNQFKHETDARIKEIRANAESEHQKMKEHYSFANAAHDNQDEKTAKGELKKAEEHKQKRDDLNARANALVEKIRDKKRETQASIEECKDPSYEEKSQAYQDAQEKFENLNAEYHAAKSERDYYWREMKSVESSFSSLKNERTKTAQLLQEEETTQRVMALHNAGVEYPERADAKVLLQPDGTTQVYHGGIGYGDGYGHGHTVLDGDGKITYKREAFKPHGSQNYVKKKIIR